MQAKKWAPIVYAVLAVWAGLAMGTQFAATEEAKAHYIIVSAFSGIAYCSLRFCVPRISYRTTLASLLWGIGLSLAFIVGSALYQGDGGLWPYEPWQEIMLRGWGMAIFFGAGLACWMVSGPVEGCIPQKNVASVRGWFWAAWGVIVLSRIPYWLTFHPAVMTFDTLSQYYQIIDGVLINDHPVLHTLTLWAPVWIASLFGWSHAVGFAAYALIQVVLQAAVFAWVVAFIRQRTHSVWIPLLALGYYTLHPIHAYYSVTIWKDIPFALLITVLALLLFRVLETKGDILKQKSFLGGILCALTVLPFLRNSALFISVIILVFLLILVAAQRKRILILLGCSVAATLLIQGPVFDALHIGKTRLAERLSVPLQQIGFLVSSGYYLTPEQEEAIDAVIPVETLAEAYTPATCDDIKFHDEFNNDALVKNIDAYTELWLELGREYPEVYAEAYGLLMLRYWYPDKLPQARFYENPIPPEPEAVYFPTESVTDAFAFLWDLSPKEWVEEYPIFAPLFNEGMLIWLLLAAAGCLWVMRKARFIAVLLPPLVVWIGVMIGAPLAETRYVYPIYTCVPIIAWLMIYAKMSPRDMPLVDKNIHSA